MKKKIKYVVVVMIFGLLLFCFSFSRDNDIKYKNTLKGTDAYTAFSHNSGGDAPIQDYIPSSNSLSYGILNKEGQIIDEDKEVYIDNGESYFCYPSIQNDLGKTVCFTLVIIDNFEQKSFWADGVEMNYCTVEVKNGDNIQVPVELKNLYYGKNDLIYIWFIGTNRDMTEEQLRSINMTDNAVYNHNILCVKNDEYNDDVLQKLNFSSIDDNVFPSPNIEISIQSEYGIDNKAILDIDPHIAHYITVGNFESTSKRCILILLQNFIQTPINNNTYTCVVIPSQSFIDFDISNESMNNENVELSAVLIDCSKESKNFSSESIYFSNRVFYR